MHFIRFSLLKIFKWKSFRCCYYFLSLHKISSSASFKQIGLFFLLKLLRLWLWFLLIIIESCFIFVFSFRLIKVFFCWILLLALFYFRCLDLFFFITFFIILSLIRWELSSNDLSIELSIRIINFTLKIYTFGEIVRDFVD
jgi:hypothetical protein